MQMYKKNIILLVAICFVLSFTVGNDAFALNVIYAGDPAKNIVPKESAMIISRDENRTVITVLPRYSYDGEHFGILIPLPKLVSDTQIKIGGLSAAENVLAYTSPRIASYKDVNPCTVKEGEPRAVLQEKQIKFKRFGVNGDVLPDLAKADVTIIDAEALKDKALADILKEKSLFIDKNYQSTTDAYKTRGIEYALITLPRGEDGYRSLPAVQVAYESENFTLPIGLSGHASDVAQDLTLVFITRDGMVIPKTLPVKKMVHDNILPVFVADNFTESYDAIFKKSLLDDNFQSVFLEYAGDVKWCPQCGMTKKLSVDNLKQLGAWWLDSLSMRTGSKKGAAILDDIDNVYLTRLHLRHTGKTILNSVDFTHSKDKNRFVTSYKVHKPFLDTPKCELGRLYKAQLPTQYQSQLDSYVGLTGLAVKEIKDLMEENGQSFTVPMDESEKNWWERMWGIGAQN